jgi:hypothetical protein
VETCHDFGDELAPGIHMRWNASPVPANGVFNRAAIEQIGAATKSCWYHGEYLTNRDHVWSVYISCVDSSTSLV